MKLDLAFQPLIKAKIKSTTAFTLFLHVPVDRLTIRFQIVFHVVENLKKFLQNFLVRIIQKIRFQYVQYSLHLASHTLLKQNKLDLTTYTQLGFKNHSFNVLYWSDVCRKIDEKSRSLLTPIRT